MDGSEQRTRAKIAATARRYVHHEAFNANSDSDIAAEATRQAIVQAYINSLAWPAGNLPHAHFCGAMVAIWLIAMSETGRDNAETTMLGLFEWGRDFAFAMDDEDRSEPAA